MYFFNPPTMEYFHRNVSIICTLHFFVKLYSSSHWKNSADYKNMPSINLIELVEQAKVAGFTPVDINLLVAKEEEIHKKEDEREERQKERDVKTLELEAIEAEKERERQTLEAEKQRAHELALANLKLETREPNQSNDSYPGLRLPHFQDGEDEIDDFLKRFDADSY